MSSNILEVSEGIQYQSSDEELCYRLTTTNWVSNPTNPVIKAYDETIGNEDVTDTYPDSSDGLFPTNNPLVDGDQITLSPLKNLIAGHIYRIEVRFAVGDNIYSAHFKVQCPF